ncbi:MAG: secretin N-terminal domain-containing protein [Holosporaceae bacterium]|nr:secretin N-terminal domain-containing protein [Holosporaceae bacterium]
MAEMETQHRKFFTPSSLNTLLLPVDDADANIDDGSADGQDDGDFEQVIGEKFHKRISVSANENMRMREVLTQMAHLAGVNVFIAEDIGGSVSFMATNRKFIDIMKDICDSANLRYFISGDSVKIENDVSMLKFYNVPFLNIQRDTQSLMSISTDIFNNGSISDTEVKSGPSAKTSAVGVSSSGAALSNNGSASVVVGSAKNDFWRELENTLKCIVGIDNKSSDDATNAPMDAYVTVHQQAGIIAAYTTQSKHEKIKKYLKLLRETSETQVLIEAKILEVCLSSEHKSGIDWHIVDGNLTTTKSFGTGELFTMGIDRNSLRAIVGFLEKFGAVKTLSSPRLTILNNHSAILKVAKNEVIYIPELQKQYGSVSNPISMDFISANIKTIPIGLVMMVQPSIDRKNNTIMLNIRPTISKIAGHMQVPSLLQSYNLQTPGGGNAAAMATNSTSSAQKIPIVDVREMDSVLKLNSGQVVVMGGLMQETSSRNRSGIPGFADTPVDWIFGSRENGTNVTELVIFLKATIVRQKNRGYHNADKKMYNTFAKDSRPLIFGAGKSEKSTDKIGKK